MLLPLIPPTGEPISVPAPGKRTDPNNAPPMLPAPDPMVPVSWFPPSKELTKLPAPNPSPTPLSAEVNVAPPKIPVVASGIPSPTWSAAVSPAKLGDAKPSEVPKSLMVEVTLERLSERPPNRPPLPSPLEPKSLVIKLPPCRASPRVIVEPVVSVSLVPGVRNSPLSLAADDPPPRRSPRVPPPPPNRLPRLPSSDPNVPNCWLAVPSPRIESTDPIAGLISANSTSWDSIWPSTCLTTAYQLVTVCPEKAFCRFWVIDWSMSLPTPSIALFN